MMTDQLPRVEQRATRPCQRADLTTAPIGDELALYHPTTGQAIVLNRSAAAIWELCDGQHTAQAIAEDLATLAGLPVAEILADVARALEQFQDLGLIEEAAHSTRNEGDIR